MDAAAAKVNWNMRHRSFKLEDVKEEIPRQVKSDEPTFGVEDNEAIDDIVKGDAEENEYELEEIAVAGEAEKTLPRRDADKWQNAMKEELTNINKMKLEE